jgi:hypothetical protein
LSECEKNIMHRPLDHPLTHSNMPQYNVRRPIQRTELNRFGYQNGSAAADALRDAFYLLLVCTQAVNTAAAAAAAEATEGEGGQCAMLFLNGEAGQWAGPGTRGGKPIKAPSTAKRRRIASDHHRSTTSLPLPEEFQSPHTTRFKPLSSLQEHRSFSLSLLMAPPSVHVSSCKGSSSS